MKLDPLGFKTYTHIYTDRVPLITGSHFSHGQLFIRMPCQPTNNPSHLDAGAAVVEWITSWTINPTDAIPRLSRDRIMVDPPLLRSFR